MAKTTSYSILKRHVSHALFRVPGARRRVSHPVFFFFSIPILHRKYTESSGTTFFCASDSGTRIVAGKAHEEFSFWFKCRSESSTIEKKKSTQTASGLVLNQEIQNLSWKSWKSIKNCFNTRSYKFQVVHVWLHKRTAQTFIGVQIRPVAFLPEVSLF